MKKLLVAIATSVITLVLGLGMYFLSSTRVLELLEEITSLFLRFPLEAGLLLLLILVVILFLLLIIKVLTQKEKSHNKKK